MADHSQTEATALWQHIIGMRTFAKEGTFCICLFVVNGHRPLTYHSITKIYKQ